MTPHGCRDETTLWLGGHGPANSQRFNIHLHILQKISTEKFI